MCPTMVWEYLSTMTLWGSYLGEQHAFEIKL